MYDVSFGERGRKGEVGGKKGGVSGKRGGAKGWEGTPSAAVYFDPVRLLRIETLLHPLLLQAVIGNARRALSESPTTHFGEKRRGRHGARRASQQAEGEMFAWRELAHGIWRLGPYRGKAGGGA